MGVSSTANKTEAIKVNICIPNKKSSHLSVFKLKEYFFKNLIKSNTLSFRPIYIFLPPGLTVPHQGEGEGIFNQLAFRVMFNRPGVARTVLQTASSRDLVSPVCGIFLKMISLVHIFEGHT